MISTGLAIREVAERTGIAAGTIRMWEQRFGFPDPERTPSGYRIYSESDVEALRRVVAFRRRGLSVPAAIERAVQSGELSDRPSIYAAVASIDHGAQAQRLRKSTLIELSRAIEDQAIALAASPLVFGAFQRTSFYAHVRERWTSLADNADAAVVFADFPGVRHPEGAPAEIPIAPDDALGNEWAVIIDAPGYCACLIAWEVPEPHRLADRERRFESIWTIDPRATRRATEVAAKLAGRADPALGARLDELLADRPLAMEEPLPTLTALTNRVVAYLESAA